MVPFVVTDNSINLTLKSKMYVCQKSHPNFEAIKAVLKQDTVDEDALLNLVDIKKSLESFSSGKVKVVDDVLTYDGRELDNSLTRRIMAMIKDGFNVVPLIKFLDNLMLNPSARAVNEFYEFLERNKLPLTEDGCFLAYKKVCYDYFDIHSHSMNNAVGEVVEMPRNAVDDDKEQTCSYGLHFASFNYMPNYASNDVDDHVVIVKVNPRDVVSFPVDYDRAKGRTCRYEVVDEIKNDGKTEIKDWFASEKDYGKSLEVLAFIKGLDIFKDNFNVKYSSNLSELGLNSYEIRSVIDAVVKKYEIATEFKYESLEYVGVHDLVSFVVDETPRTLTQQSAPATLSE